MCVETGDPTSRTAPNRRRLRMLAWGRPGPSRRSCRRRLADSRRWAWALRTTASLSPPPRTAISRPLARRSIGGRSDTIRRPSAHYRHRAGRVHSARRIGPRSDCLEQQPPLSLLASLTFTAADPGTLVEATGSSRCPARLSRSPGNYTVIAYGYGPGGAERQRGETGPTVRHA